MPHELSSTDPEFAQQFQALVADRRESGVDVGAAVHAILHAVRSQGDRALLDYTKRFDRLDVSVAELKISVDACVQAERACHAQAQALAALRLAAQRIRTFHEAQRPQDYAMTEPSGVVTGYRWSAIEAVGVYVPGGLAAYPSSVLMNCIPAKVAGVRRLVMVTPTPDGVVNPLVLAAARLAGVDEIYRIGGAQAIGALAYGTPSLPAVDKIVGPGNAYVAEAKRQVFGVVGIDMVAGPSEVLIIADKDNDPSHIAADLLSQAEHDVEAQAILITDDADFAKAVRAAVEAHLPGLATSARARASWARYGVVITVQNLREEAPMLANALAAEHVQLCVPEPEALLARIQHAGSVFLGRMTPEALGDYVAGPNHVLPTGRRARFASGLGVTDFMKRTTYLHVPAHAYTALGEAAAALADAEGLPAHALSARLRLERFPVK
jgi:histidinol dehydrogenase